MSTSASIACDVIIPFHRAHLLFVKDAIDSILHQSNERCIIHVIADGVREDEDSDIRLQYRDANIHWYRNPEPIGPYQSLHTIYQHLKTDYIAIQDSDDIALPHRISYSIASLRKYNADIFGGSMEHFVDWHSKGDPRFAEVMRNHPVICSGPPTSSCPNGRLINGAILLKRSTFEKLNGFAEWFCGCDAEFIERARSAGVVLHASRTVVGLRRLHSSSLCYNQERGMDSEYRQKILKEMFRRFTEFTPGFDPRKYGCLDRYHTSKRPIEYAPRSVSACLVSWKRPQNISHIIRKLRSYSFIDDIVIWNNNPDVHLSIKDENVTVIQSEGNMMTYGRYLATEYAKHDVIYTQDDDCVVRVAHQLYRMFLSDQVRITHGLQPKHFARQAIDHYGSAHMALVGWGAIFKKEWIAVLKKYTDLFGMDDVFLSEADRIFSLLLNCRHNSLLSDVRHLDGTSGTEALWQRPDHWKHVACAVERCTEILNLRGENGKLLTYLAPDTVSV